MVHTPLFSHLRDTRVVCTPLFSHLRYTRVVGMYTDLTPQVYRVVYTVLTPQGYPGGVHLSSLSGTRVVYTSLSSQVPGYICLSSLMYPGIYASFFHVPGWVSLSCTRGGIPLMYPGWWVCTGCTTGWWVCTGCTTVGTARYPEGYNRRGIASQRGKTGGNSLPGWV